MKQVKLEKPKQEIETIALQDVDLNKFYGVEFIGGRRGIVRRRNYDSGKFTILSLRQFTNGNGWISFDSDTFAGMGKKLYKIDAKIFQFDSILEAVQWASQE